jgi:hypothetical protein
MRYWFGGQPADYVIASGPQVDVGDGTLGATAALVSGVVLHVWDITTGHRITDLLNATGEEVAELISEDRGLIPRFRGPDETKALLIGPAQVDPDTPQDQWIITSTDWPTITDRLAERVAALEDGGGSGGDPGEVIATAHPMIWAVDGDVTEDRISAHRYWNLEGKSQTITAVLAQATVTTGSLTCTVYTIDPDTGVISPIGAVVLDTTTGRSSITPDAVVSAGTGVTVGIERGAETAEVADVTVQVMIR